MFSLLLPQVDKLVKWDAVSLQRHHGQVLSHNKEFVESVIDNHIFKR